MTAPSRSSGSGWAGSLERVARLIPGVAGYQDREGLRETDKQVRLHLAGRIAELASLLERAEHRLTEANRLDRLPAVDRVVRLLGTLADQTRYASYGFAGVFDLHKIREGELTTLHRFDLGLLEALPGLRQRIASLADAVMDEAGFPPAVQAAEEALRDFEGTLTERDRLARGL